ncbi:MAG: hypothetical protein IPP47_12135 [Bryobacterales bacterium]|nr:hypothetical protein [Bryobacterales bacterium]
MPLDGALTIRVTDIYDQAIVKAADITLRRKDGPVVFHQPNIDISQPLKITNLDQGPGALFQLTIDSPSYLPVSAFVNLPASGASETFALPFRPAAVRSVRFAEYFSLPSEARALIDAPTYLNLETERKAGLLNIIAKTQRTLLPNNRTVLSCLTRLLRTERDRIFVEVAPELLSGTQSALETGNFRQVSSSMHTPPEGYQRGPSYKTKERFGNLQVTLFHCPGKPPIADIDIDNAAGLLHLFQVARNALHGPTHPYDIQAILLATKEAGSFYTLSV